jgi:hypothetical protein
MRALLNPEVMRFLLKLGADPKFVFHADYVPDGAHCRKMSSVNRQYVTTIPHGGRREWVAAGNWAPVDRSTKGCT